MSRKTRVTDYLNSFFREKVIETFESDINPLIEVSFQDGRYQLNAGNVNYSFGPLHDAFRKYFHYDPPHLNGKSKVLLLGFGAGSVIRILQEELQFKCSYTGVEVDHAIIQAARKHFFLDRVENLEVIISDAYSFIEHCTDAYDLIVVDIYIEDKVPVKFETTEFLYELSNCLTRGGKVVFNKLLAADGDIVSVEALLHRFERVFDRTMIFKIPVNRVSPNYFITGEIG